MVRRSLVPELRSLAAQQLPDHMVPSVLVVLDKFPRLPNGKLDYAALPLPDQVDRQADRPLVPPRNPIEAKLVDIWCELLGLEQISIHDNFFHLGGHSLLATQVVSRVRQAYDVDLRLMSIFEVPTVAGLAEHVQTLAWAGQGGQTSRPDEDWEELRL
jgi:acyl carrier protein